MAPAPEILKEIESLATSKNPLAVLFSIAKIRETVLELGDSLINSIETSYYDDTARKFVEVTDKYREAGFYKIMYAHYLDSGKFAEQKAYLDRYFEESYYRDPDFFFFVLDKHPLFHTQFECLKAFAADENVGKGYSRLEHPEEKAEFLEKLSEDFSVIRDVSAMPMFQWLFDQFCEFPFASHPEFSSNRERTGRSGRLVARDLFFASLRNCDGESGMRHLEFWSKSFVHTSFVRNELIDMISNGDVLDCFSFLRSKFLRAPKYNIALTSGNAYQKLINRARKVSTTDVPTKLGFVTEVDVAMGENPIYRERFLNVLRKGIVYDNSIDLVDVLFGISFLGREAFYAVKRLPDVATWAYNSPVDFPHLENVKALALLLDGSFLMRLVRPFLIKRLSAMFNKKADAYYFVKFLLTIHSAKNYKEYKVMSRFFIALEAHSKTGLYGVFLRVLQYWWVWLTAIVAFFIAPLWTFISLVGIFSARLVRRFFEKYYPDAALNSNFQITGFLTVFAVVSATFALTFARTDNVAIIYSNFQSAINAVSMVASESSTLIAEGIVIKTSSVESGEGDEKRDTESALEKIDYVNGNTYEKVRK